MARYGEPPCDFRYGRRSLAETIGTFVTDLFNFGYLLVRFVEEERKRFLPRFVYFDRFCCTLFPFRARLVDSKYGFRVKLLARDITFVEPWIEFFILKNKFVQFNQWFDLFRFLFIYLFCGRGGRKDYNCNLKKRYIKGR